MVLTMYGFKQSHSYRNSDMTIICKMGGRGNKIIILFPLKLSFSFIMLKPFFLVAFLGSAYIQSTSLILGASRLLSKASN